ncbi:hypothetical protein J6590_094171 [Homalodisca vitripennis]|nr:hypothetical protein J6590_094171 [Homalodisca vitripennis]
MLGRSTSNVVMSWAPQRVGPVDVVSGGGTCAWPIPFLFYLPWSDTGPSLGKCRRRSVGDTWMEDKNVGGGNNGVLT